MALYAPGSRSSQVRPSASGTRLKMTSISAAQRSGSTYSLTGTSMRSSVWSVVPFSTWASIRLASSISSVRSSTWHPLGIGPCRPFAGYRVRGAPLRPRRPGGWPPSGRRRRGGRRAATEGTDISTANSRGLATKTSAGVTAVTEAVRGVPSSRRDLADEVAATEHGQLLLAGGGVAGHLDLALGDDQQLGAVVALVHHDLAGVEAHRGQRRVDARELLGRAAVEEGDVVEAIAGVGPLNMDAPFLGGSQAGAASRFRQPRPGPGSFPLCARFTCSPAARPPSPGRAASASGIDLGGRTGPVPRIGWLAPLLLIPLVVSSPAAAQDPPGPGDHRRRRRHPDRRPNRERHHDLLRPGLPVGQRGDRDEPAHARRGDSAPLLRQHVAVHVPADLQRRRQASRSRPPAPTAPAGRRLPPASI